MLTNVYFVFFPIVVSLSDSNTL